MQKQLCNKPFSNPGVGQENGDMLHRRTEERAAELANALSLLNATLDCTTDGILVVDLEGRITSFNCKFVEMWRLSREVLSSRDDNEALGAVLGQLKDPDGFLAKVQQLYSHPEAEGRDLIEFKDGRVFERFSRPQRIGDRCVGRVWSFRDVTESRRAEAALIDASNLLETLLQHSPDFIYFKDIESRFIRYSQTLASQLENSDPDWLRGKSDFDIFDEAHARPAFEDEQEIIRTGDPMIGKMEKEVWPDGRVSWALTSKLPWRDAGGRVVGTFGISKNVTALKDAEAKLEAAHKRIVETSRIAGMAEVATGVLHNVGNVLNSVNVSATLIGERVRQSRALNVSRVASLLREHGDDLAGFLTTDPGGRQLPDYLDRLAEHISGEHAALLNELELLQKNIAHIKDIVAMQQSYATVSGVSESVKVADLVEDSLRLNAGALTRHDVKVVRQFDPDVPEIIVDKHKVLQILVNLIRNAKYACDESGRKDKQLTVRVARDGNQVRVSVCDNGVGIPRENLTRIFSHGFTTRKDGHGFGLHSGALAARELGGRLNADSGGIGQGATFTLELPLQSPSDPNESHICE